MKVICTNAKETGIPLIEGNVYTVKTRFVGPNGTGDCPIPDMEKVSGYTLEEIPGYFRVDRFITAGN